jgi:hypothetical protein
MYLATVVWSGMYFGDGSVECDVSGDGSVEWDVSFMGYWGQTCGDVCHAVADAGQ